ncbi:helix-turn-helix domain-containing protein [Patiriisocius sp.]|uniref:helix-turn-helix domain-containing protein n=1 Tax=Patiriisocius sp. TaxID=2822396 RepID=UPI003F4AB77F
MCEIELEAVWLPKDYPSVASSFGEYIRQYRLSHGYSTNELAMELNVYESTIYKWEYGESQPQQKNVKKIIEFMGYDPRIHNPLNIKNYECIT